MQCRVAAGRRVTFFFVALRGQPARHPCLKGVKSAWEVTPRRKQFKNSLRHTYLSKSWQSEARDERVS